MFNHLLYSFYSIYTLALLFLSVNLSESDNTVPTFSALKDSTESAQTDSALNLDNGDPLTTNSATKNNQEHITLGIVCLLALHYGTTSVIHS